MRVVSDTETAAACACELLTRRPFYWTENSLIVPLFTAAGLAGSCRQVRGGHTGGCDNSGAMREKEPLEPTTSLPTPVWKEGSWILMNLCVTSKTLCEEKSVHVTQGGQKINMFYKFEGKVRIKRGV